MIQIQLKDILESIDSLSRNYFSKLIVKRETILSEFNNNKAAMAKMISDDWSNIKKGEYLAIQDGEDGFPFVFRKNSTTAYKWIENYDPVHLRNSVIANILLPSNFELKDRLNQIVFLYYQYWFLKLDATIDTLTHNVCFELQELIKLLIDKELTLYRKAPTEQYLSALRMKIMSEKLLMMGNKKTINLRKF